MDNGILVVGGCHIATSDVLLKPGHLVHKEQIQAFGGHDNLLSYIP